MTLTIDELVARTEITDCLHRYARGMDRLERDLVRSVYHDGAVDDHGGVVLPVDEFIDWAFDYHAQQTGHQHYVSNITIERDGDTAHVESYYTFVGSYAGDQPTVVAGGRYVDRFERRDSRWAIAARACTFEWFTKHATKLSGDRTGTTASARVARDRTDVSYDRPLVVPPAG